VEAFYDKVNHLKLKLNIKKEEQEDLTHSQLMEQKYHLLDIADTLLTADQLKRKRIQKMQKTAATLRENKKKVVLEAKQKLEELKSSDNKNYYLRGAYLKRKELLERIADRKKQREEFGKRGTQIAQQRMQKIVELGKEEKLTAAMLQDITLPKNKDTTLDNFGMDDEDWHVYKDI